MLSVQSNRKLIGSIPCNIHLPAVLSRFNDIMHFVYNVDKNLTRINLLVIINLWLAQLIARRSAGNKSWYPHGSFCFAHVLVWYVSSQCQCWNVWWLKASKLRRKREENFSAAKGNAYKFYPTIIIRKGFARPPKQPAPNASELREALRRKSNLVFHSRLLGFSQNWFPWNVPSEGSV